MKKNFTNMSDSLTHRLSYNSEIRGFENKELI